MPIGPVNAITTAATGAETILRRAALTVDATDGRAARLEVGLHRQPGSLQGLEAGDSLLGEGHTTLGNRAVPKIDHDGDVVIVGRARRRVGEEHNGSNRQ
jgi:hypothetical protein